MPPKIEGGEGGMEFKSAPIVQARAPLSMTLEQGAKELGISRPYLDQLIKAGEIKTHTLRPGGDRRVSYWELQQFVERREQTGFQR